MADDDKRDLPLDPSDWERTELYREDDETVAGAIHEAKTQVFDDDSIDVSDVTAAPESPERLRAWLWIGGALALGIGALAVVDHLAGGNSESTAAPRERPRATTPARVAPPATPDAAARAAAQPTADATPASIPADFTTAFRRSQGAVQGCLSDHAADAGDAERVTLRFDIRTDGSVETASVTPDAIAKTALGDCLLSVARATQFAPQRQPVGIRIPIALKRR